MKAFYTLILVLIAGTAFGQQTNPNKLPICPRPDYSKTTDPDRFAGWKNCWGRYRIELDEIYKGDVLEGEWLNGWLHGKSTYLHANGDKYVGEYQNGFRSGQGIYYFLADGPNKGDKYVGEYRDGEINGHGTYYFLADNKFKGDKYVGKFKNGKQNGQGTYFYANGDKFVGEFKDGIPDRQGTLNYSNGDKYTGEFKNMVENGQGIYYFLADNQFKGDKYVGEFKDGKKYGMGSYKWKNGDEYVGEFKDDASHGQGIYTFTDGRKWQGEWLNWKLNGRAIKYNYSGKVQESGIYKDNTLVTSQYVDPNSFTRTAGNNTAPVVSDSQRQAVEQSTAKFTKTVQGCLVWVNPTTNRTKITWDGQCINGYAAGQGKFTWHEENELKLNYVGGMYLGKFHGYGIISQANGIKYEGELQNDEITGQGTFTLANGDKHVGDFKDGKRNGRGIFYSANGSIAESGIYKDNVLITSQYIDPNSFTRIARNNSAPVISDSQRQAIEQRERQIALDSQRVAEERLKLELDKAQREKEKRSSRIVITASATQPDSNGVVTINIQTNTDTSSLKINGDEIGGKSDGIYSVKRIARVGQETKFALVAMDVYGNTDSKTITVVRQAADSKAVFSQLNAANVRQQPARDAVAIIIGIERYKRVAKADYANADAQDFYDYASRALGIKPENIKLLVDDGADDVEIYKAFQNWLPVKVKKGKTDVYVFYSGHGYPGLDDNSLYILPYGADKDLISKTAINQQDIVNAIQNAQPRTVTMFLDSCYSGQTRGGDVLIAGARPITPKISSNSYPPNFTVISASSNDQISSASPDLKHGIFSYYLMKGMEGEADLNRDGAITVSEMHEFLTDMVGRQAMSMNRKQQPQLLGVTERVLVGK